VEAKRLILQIAKSEGESSIVMIGNVKSDENREEREEGSFLCRTEAQQIWQVKIQLYLNEFGEKRTYP
jgi:hypothetical protein